MLCSITILLVYIKTTCICTCDVSEVKLLPNQKHPWCKKSCGQELKKGLDKKEVKSKWAAKACVVLLLIKIKF